MIAALNALPAHYAAVGSRYAREAQRAYTGGTRHFGPLTEDVVEEILRTTGLPLTKPDPLYPVLIEGKVRGRVKPYTSW